MDINESDISIIKLRASKENDPTPRRIYKKITQLGPKPSISGLDVSTRVFASFDRWNWFSCIILICLSYVIPCFFFAGIYYFLEMYSFDNAFNEIHEKDSGKDDSGKEDSHCFQLVNHNGHTKNETWPNFTGLLQFSFETQSSIGYGHHYVQDSCSLPLIFIWIQFISTNMILFPILTGLVVRKILNPINEIEEFRNNCRLRSIDRGIRKMRDDNMEHLTRCSSRRESL